MHEELIISSTEAPLAYLRQSGHQPFAFPGAACFGPAPVEAANLVGLARVNSVQQITL